MDINPLKILEFKRKKIEFFIKDKDIAKDMRIRYKEKGEAWGYFLKLVIAKGYGMEYLEKLVLEGKLEPNFMEKFKKISEKTVGKKLIYRGVTYHDYKNYFLAYGNTRTAKNVSIKEKIVFRKNGIKPEDTIYASEFISKAWDFAAKENPSVIIVYNPDMLKHLAFKIEDMGGTYLYMLKKGFSWFDAVVAYVLFWYI
jgi:hypothetical protein